MHTPWKWNYIYIAGILSKNSTEIACIKPHGHFIHNYNFISKQIFSNLPFTSFVQSLYNKSHSIGYFMGTNSFLITQAINSHYLNAPKSVWFYTLWTSMSYFSFCVYSYIFIVSYSAKYVMALL